MSQFRTVLLLGLGLYGPPAAAKDLVVYQGESSSVAISRVVMADHEVDISSLQPVDLGKTLKEASPGLAGPGSLQNCETTEKPGLDIVRAALEQAREDVGFVDWEAAAESFKTASTALFCLGEALDPKLAGQLYFLEGVSHLGQSDKPSAWESFRQARLFDPQLQWDESYAPEGKPTFIAAVAELDATAKQPLYLLPGPTEGQVIIDGQPVPAGAHSIQLHQGVHILQWTGESSQTATLEIVPGPASALLISDQIPENLLDWATGSAEKQAAIRASLGAVDVESASTIYLSTPKGIWKTALGLNSWDRIHDSTEKPVVLSPAKPQVRPDWTRTQVAQVSLLGSGSALTIVGGILCYRAYQSLGTTYDELVIETDEAVSVYNPDLSYDEVVDGRTDYSTQTTDYYKGLAITSVGAALMASSLVVKINSMSLSPWALGGMGTVGLQLHYQPITEPGRP